jgi:hypothetical protein
MRKITKESIRAFMSASNFNKGNTKVEVLDNVTILKLCGNAIAYRYNNPIRTISITNCGWESKTTKERLNGIEGVSISQIKGQWYLNGEEWNGNLIDIN